MKKDISKFAVCAALAQTAAAGAAQPPVNADLDGQQITRAGEQAAIAGPDDYFTGRARIDPVWPADKDVNASGAFVTFEPGARTAWHTHPLGQTLIVVSGFGRVQREGGRVEEIRPGDVVWFAPGEKHWHGASPDVAMTHIALQEVKDGKVVDWMEHVTDAQYGA